MKVCYPDNRFYLSRICIHQEIVLIKNISYKNSDKVQDKKQHRGIYHRLIGSPAHPGSTFAAVVSFITAHQANGKPEKEGLDGGRDQVTEFQGLKDLVEIEMKRNVPFHVLYESRTNNGYKVTIDHQ